MDNKKKTQFQNRAQKKDIKAEGEGIAEIVRNRDKSIVPTGFFRIIRKEYDEETKEYKYKFEWDEKFARYAADVLQAEEGVDPDTMDVFCYNILLAQKEDQLEDGVKVTHLNEEREKENKRKFYKKY